MLFLEAKLRAVAHLTGVELEAIKKIDDIPATGSDFISAIAVLSNDKKLPEPEELDYCFIDLTLATLAVIHSIKVMTMTDKEKLFLYEVITTMLIAIDTIYGRITEGHESYNYWTTKLFDVVRDYIKFTE